jgi:hypothetical protein
MRKGKALWNTSGNPEVLQRPTRYLQDIGWTSVRPLEHLWRGGSRGATEVLQRSTRYLLEVIRFRTRWYLVDICQISLEHILYSAASEVCTDISGMYLHDKSRIYP